MPTTEQFTHAPWMQTAVALLGTREIGGSKHNPKIVEFFRKAGHPEIRDDETAWCSGFVNAVLSDHGIVGTRNLMARSWLKWGTPVVTPRYGDVVVFSRGSDPVYGHVAFFEKWDNDFVYVLGGNQSDAVTRTRISRSKLLGIRRPVQTTSRTEQPSDGATEAVKTVGSAGAAGVAVAAYNPDPLVVLTVTLGLTLLTVYFIYRKWGS